MQITLTITGDNMEELAAELLRMAKQFAVLPAAPEYAREDVLAPPLEKTSPKAAKKTKAEKPAPAAEEPPDEEEKATEPPAGGEEKSDPEADWKAACDLLMNHWTAHPEDKEKVLDVAASFGVKKFSEVPKEKGTELLAKARALASA